MPSRITRKWTPAGSNSCERTETSTRNRRNALISKPFQRAEEADRLGLILSLTGHPVVCMSVSSMSAVVTIASQAGIPRAKNSPTKATADSSTALNLNACSKGIGQFLDLGRMHYAIGCGHCRRMVGIGPRYDGDGIATLGIMRECSDRIKQKAVALSGRVAFAQGEQAQHGEQMVGTGAESGIFSADNQTKGVRFLGQLPQERCDQSHTAFKERVPILWSNRRKHDRDAALIFGFGLSHD